MTVTITLPIGTKLKTASVDPEKLYYWELDSLVEYETTSEPLWNGREFEISVKGNTSVPLYLFDYPKESLQVD